MGVMAREARDNFFVSRVNDAGSHRMRKDLVALVACPTDLQGIARKEGGPIGAMGHVADGTAAIFGLFRVKGPGIPEALPDPLMTRKADPPLFSRQQPLEFRGVRGVTCGALAGSDREMDLLFPELLDHRRMAGQAELLAREDRFRRVGSRDLVAASTAALGKGRVGNRFEQGLIIGAVRIMALLAGGLLYRKG